MAGAIQVTLDKPSYNIGDTATVTIVDPTAYLDLSGTWTNAFGGTGGALAELKGGGKWEDDIGHIKWTTQSATWSTGPDGKPVLTAVVTGTVVA